MLFDDDYNEHELAWKAKDWNKVKELTKEYTYKPSSAFEILDQISFTKTKITAEQLELYDKWFINSGLSQNIDCLMQVDQMNLYGSGLSDFHHYNYYLMTIRKMKRRGKWAKPTYNKRLEIYKALLSKHYKINLKDAELYYNILGNKINLISLKYLINDEFKSKFKDSESKKIIEEVQ